MDLTTILIGICALLFVLVMVSIIMNMINSSKINTLTEFAEEGDLVASLQHYYERVDELSQEMKETVPASLAKRVALCENAVKQTYSKLAIVNFDAFDDVTGKLSFALTLLNEHNSGVIITSLYGHNSNNTYIRAVNNGMSATKLLDEEKLSLSSAIKSAGATDAAKEE